MKDFKKGDQLRLSQRYIFDSGEYPKGALFKVLKFNENKLTLEDNSGNIVVTKWTCYFKQVKNV